MNADRVGSSQLEALALRLSSRDWHILRSLDEHRFLLTSQLQRLHFSDHRSASAGIRACVRVLDRLRALRILTRLERRIGGLHAGSRAFVWCLDSVGDRLVRLGATERPARRQVFEPTIRFLEHTLAVAELRVQVEKAARSGALELLSVQTEPGCWRNYVDPHGGKATLKPDLALVTAAGDYEDHWLIEIDRGTESIRTLLAKCVQYEHYRRSGREQAESGVYPLVFWSVPDAPRRDRLLREIEKSAELDAGLYRVATSNEAVGLITGTSSSPQPEAVLASEPPQMNHELTERSTP